MLVEDVNMGSEVLVVCLEGLILMDDSSIKWRKNAKFVAGVIWRRNQMVIEYFTK